MVPLCLPEVVRAEALLAPSVQRPGMLLEEGEQL